MFNSSVDKHHVGQFGSRHCRATSRAVSARVMVTSAPKNELVPKHEKSPRFNKPGTFRLFYRDALPQPDHTCFTRLSIRRVYDRLATGSAGFTKISVYFLCKVCYTIISVRRDGQTRADIERKYAICRGQNDHLPDDSGSKGVALAA